MAQPEFDITIGLDGKLHVEIKGSQGAECMKLADMIRDIVGKEEEHLFAGQEDLPFESGAVCQIDGEFKIVDVIVAKPAGLVPRSHGFEPFVVDFGFPCPGSGDGSRAAGFTSG